MSAAEYVPESGGVAELRAAAKECHGCELWEPATQTVFGAGSPGAKIVVVGEQPGDVEDQRGLPFVGPAGQLLQKALDEAGVDRSILYVTNAVKHFRFTWQGKRRIHQTPDASHVTACRPWLEAEIARVDPQLVLVLGATAGKSLLGSAFRVTKDRGVVFERETPVGRRRFLATIHPSAILRMDAELRDQGYADFVTDLRTAVAAAAAV
jgi:uracil-DNA glycosylase family protein